MIADVKDSRAEAELAQATTRLRAAMRGDVLTPDDEGYEAARLIYNGMIDKRPALIARCLGAGDIVAAVKVVRDET